MRVVSVVVEARKMVFRMAGLDSNSTPLPSCVIWDKSLHLSEPNFMCSSLSWGC